MAANTLQEITLRLPADVYARLLHTAAFRQQSPEYLAVETLDITLPDAAAQADMQLDREIARLRSLSEEQLQASTQAHLPAKDQQRLADLMEKNIEGELTKAEQAETERLLDKIEAIATERAAALWLLRESSFSGKTS